MFTSETGIIPDAISVSHGDDYEDGLPVVWKTFTDVSEAIFTRWRQQEPLKIRYNTTRHNISENIDLHICRSENLKSHVICLRHFPGINYIKYILIEPII